MEVDGSDGFTPMGSGQAARLGRQMSAGDLTRHLASEALARLEVSLQEVQSDPG
jgi:nitronate monooxygenase